MDQRVTLVQHCSNRETWWCVCGTYLVRVASRKRSTCHALYSLSHQLPVRL